MNGTRELETGRLRLRRYRMEDAELLHQYFGIDEKMYEYSGWNPYATPEMAQASVREFIGSYDNPAFYGWAIELKKDSDYVFAGTVGAYDYDPEAGTAEVGLSVRRDLWGRGIAGESLKAVIEYLTCEEKIPCIKAWCAASNIGSKKAMEKAGMRLVSTETAALRVGDKVYDKLNYEFRVSEQSKKNTPQAPAAAAETLAAVTEAPAAAADNPADASDSTDLTFCMKQGTFNYRVGAIIIHIFVVQCCLQVIGAVSRAQRQCDAVSLGGRKHILHRRGSLFPHHGIVINLGNIDITHILRGIARWQRMFFVCTEENAAGICQAGIIFRICGCRCKDGSRIGCCGGRSGRISSFRCLRTGNSRGRRGSSTLFMTHRIHKRNNACQDQSHHGYYDNQALIAQMSFLSTIFHAPT